MSAQSVIKSSIRLFSGFLKVRNLDLETPSFLGGSFKQTREVVEQKDSVHVLVVDPWELTMLVLEQYRPGPTASGRYDLVTEPIAGCCDKEGASIEQVMADECLEEANLTIDPSEFQTLAVGWSSPGVSTETMTLAVTYQHLVNVVDGSVFGLTDEGEQTRVRVVPLNETVANPSMSMIALQALVNQELS